MELNEKIKLLEPILARHQFGSLTEAEVDQLKVGSMLLPKLMGQDCRLLYTEPRKAEDRISKSKLLSKSSSRNYTSSCVLTSATLFWINVEVEFGESYQLYFGTLVSSRDEDEQPLDWPQAMLCTNSYTVLLY